RLLAPDQLHGAIQVQTDLVGAEVELDGKPLGKTPLARNGVIAKLALGKHRLKVAAPDYEQPYEDDVDVRFQKVSPVVGRVVRSTQVVVAGVVQPTDRRPFHPPRWFATAAGAAAAGLGAAIGYRLGHVPSCHYDAQGVAHGC